MKLVEFDLVGDGQERSKVWLAVSEIESVVEYEDRWPYGGYFPAARIKTKTGDEHRVYGYVSDKIRKLLEEIGS